MSLNSSSLLGHASSRHPSRAEQTVSQSAPPAPFTQTTAAPHCSNEAARVQISALLRAIDEIR